MKKEKKTKQKQQPIQTINVGFYEIGIMDQTRPLPGSYYNYLHKYQCAERDNLNTQTLMKGVDWNDEQLIRNGIMHQGNVNYTYKSQYIYEINQRGTIQYTYDAQYTYPHNKLNLIQIACKEKKIDTIKALLASPDLNINVHKLGTYPAIHLAIKRGDKDIIRLLFDFVGKEYDNFVHDAYYTAYTYVKNDKCNELSNYFIHAEKMLHRFLRFEASLKQYALFTHILKEKYVEDREEIPKELQHYITTLYYMLNINTVIANRYKHKRKYYNCSMETKIKKREQLLKNPKPQLLWDV